MIIVVRLIFIIATGNIKYGPIVFFIKKNLIISFWNNWRASLCCNRYVKKYTTIQQVSSIW
ncbi:hypothetical protein D083_0990 [Dickeya solani RNS 08.23.3.1.A]|nr:hypothetical protein D083_0990 [Dickeya solani RNS 08.23.3.1.A]